MPELEDRVDVTSLKMPLEAKYTIIDGQCRNDLKYSYRIDVSPQDIHKSIAESIDNSIRNNSSGHVLDCTIFLDEFHPVFWEIPYEDLDSISENNWKVTIVATPESSTKIISEVNNGMARWIRDGLAVTKHYESQASNPYANFHLYKSKKNHDYPISLFGKKVFIPLGEKENTDDSIFIMEGDAAPGIINRRLEIFQFEDLVNKQPTDINDLLKCPKFITMGQLVTERPQLFTDGLPRLDKHYQ